MAEFLSNADFEGDADLSQALEFLRVEHEQDVAVGNGPPELSGFGDLSSKEFSGGKSGQCPDCYLAYLLWLMDLDRKSPGLKTIQGKIWEFGYQSGELKGELYPDVAPAMNRWRSSGSRIYIYSSGSVLAQKLLFQYSVDGDLTPLIEGYFDTGVGPKRSAASYGKIVSSVGVPSAEILFLSDVIEEVSAATEAGLHAIQVVRSGENLMAGQVSDFTEIAV